MIRTTSLTLLAVLLTAGGVSAQEQRHGQRPDTTGPAAAGPGMMHGSMMGAMGMMQGMAGGAMCPMMASGGMMAAPEIMRRAQHLSPSQVLSQKESLELTPPQLERLQQLLPDESAQRETMTSAHQARQELARLFDTERPNSDAVKAAAEKLFGLQAGMHAQRIAAAAAVRGILTGAQREKAMLIMPEGMSGMMGGCLMQGDMMRNTMQRGQTDRPGSEHEQHHPGRPDGNR